ncbi:MAG: RpiB/LacA/LacB family sugar-phosphate isomerase, partial [Thermacetogeniaceae bacterium]
MIKVAIGSDHAGFRLKKEIKEYFQGKDLQFTDFGVDSTDPVDYPDIALMVAESVARGDNKYGILVCGTGIG